MYVCMYVCVFVNISYVYIVYGMYVCVCVSIVSFVYVCFVFALVRKNGIVQAPEVKPLINQSINQSINQLVTSRGTILLTVISQGFQNELQKSRPVNIGQ